MTTASYAQRPGSLALIKTLAKIHGTSHEIAKAAQAFQTMEAKFRYRPAEGPAMFRVLARDLQDAIADYARLMSESEEVR